jgi:DNA replication protein DnaC
VLTNPTVDKLRALNLGGMARALAEQLERADYAALSFEERLGLLVDREAQDRDNRRLERHLKAAKLRWEASVEDVEFRHPRGLDRGQVLSLADARWVAAHQNILVTGPTGSGKTFIACALAHATVRRGHTALYLRAPRLLGDLALARADGRLPRVLASWARVDVLVVDDFALRPLLPEQTADLLEVIEDRAGRRATIVASQLPVRLWHEALAEATLADALLDRVVHNAHRIELRGDSLRRRHPDGQPDATDAATGAAAAAADGASRA